MLQIGTHPDSAGSARPPGLVRTATTYSVSTTSASVSRCPYVVPQASPGPSDAGLKHKGLTNSEGLTECGPPAYYCQHQLVNLKMIATKSLAWKWYRQTCGGIALVGRISPSSLLIYLSVVVYIPLLLTGWVLLVRPPAHCGGSERHVFASGKMSRGAV